MNIDPLLYLVAHAPAEPWPSFKPVMRPKPVPAPIPARKRVGLNDFGKEIKYREASAALEEEAERVLSANFKAEQEWSQERELQLRIQWPVYWAQQILATLPRAESASLDVKAYLAMTASECGVPVTKDEE